MYKLRSFAVTHKGAKHEAETPCQDASAHSDALESAALAIVADGHGSSRCFRSNVGSEKAVAAAKKAVEHFIQSTAVSSPEDFKAELHEMVKQIINKWFAAVMKDEEANPLQDDPWLEQIPEKYKDRYINDVDYRCHAYGTTLIVAAMSNDYWFGFQVGDGKCIALYEDGTWVAPIPWDERCWFNMTTSICDDDSLSDFRYWFGIRNEGGGYTEYAYGIEGQGIEPKTTFRPLAIFIGTDGVDDSYPSVDNDKYIINFYRNRVISLAESGFESLVEEMCGFAKRFADRESTDDVSIAGIIGDFSDKPDMISHMKQESELHETTELAAIKRRDANEKRDALAAITKAREKAEAEATSAWEKAEAEATALEAKIQQSKNPGGITP